MDDVEFQKENLEVAGSVLKALIAHYLRRVTKLATDTLKMLDHCIYFLVLDWLHPQVPCVVATMLLYHQPASWKMSQPRICMALVVITGITAACFCLGWCSRQDGQVRISLLISSDMPGQNHLSLALWIDLSTP